MGGRIREESIREVRERASLVEIVSDVVTLRRRGRSVVGLCPFHTEKTPSFTVSEERGFYHCFGCGEHGDVFAFVMKTESLTFPEAVRRVAQRFGVRLPEPTESAGPPTEPLVGVNAAAAAFFRTQLAGPAGARARRYLAERGITDASIEHYGVGYAPGGGDAFGHHLRAKRLRVEDALRVGLLVRRDRPDGSTVVVDRFRDRVMFPIMDATGRVVAFGGRILPGWTGSGDPPPKYLNSPESPLFHKGATVFGLAQARDAIRRAGRAVVVEGYLDVIAVAQAGIGEVVAPLGTALTVDQLRVLRRLTDVVIACFDGDDAGRRAAARSFPVFLEAGLWGRGAYLPTGEDPDSFVRRQGAPALAACLAAAGPLVDAYLTELAGPDRSAVGRHADAAKEVARLLKRVRTPYEHEVLVHLAAERLGVREEMLRIEGALETPAGLPTLPIAAGPSGVEERLVELMAADPDVVRRVSAENVIAEFEHPAWRQVAETLVSAADEDRSALLQTLPRELRDRVARRLLGEIVDEDRQREVADYIASIRSRGQRRTQTQLRAELRDAEARGDEAAAAALTKKLAALVAGEHTQKVSNQE
jgi:DNA primase